MITVEIVILAVSFVGLAFFAGTETGLITMDRVKLQYMADRGSKRAKVLCRFLKDPVRTLTTNLVGINISVALISTTSTSILLDFALPEAYWHWAPVLVTAVLAPLILFFGEITPKMFFLSDAESRMLKVSPILQISAWLLKPISWFLDRITSKILGAHSASAKNNNADVTRDELRIMLDMMREQEELTMESHRLLLRLFAFSDKRVSEAMVPLAQVAALSHESHVIDAAAKMTESGYSKLPIFKDRIDNLVGIVYSHDLISASEANAPVKSVMRDVKYIPESKYADELLVEFQEQGLETCIAVDEYGAAVGLISTGDILEELVGELPEETVGAGSSTFTEIAPGRFLVDGDMEIEEVRDQFGLTIPDGPYETLAGYILERLQRIPKMGAATETAGWRLVVKEVKERRISKVELIQLKSESATRDVE